MKLLSQSISDGAVIAGEYAFCVSDAQTHVTLAANRSPGLDWQDIPAGAKSLVLICHDPDVPSKGDDVNQEGREVPADLPRVDFYHWVLVDIPVTASGLDQAADADGVVAGGKASGGGPLGARRGINNYTDWFAGDTDMGGDYYGYDGPCPPWNDTVVHHYHFTLYATDLERCPVAGRFGGPEVLAAIEGRVLAKASLIGTYSLNPEVPA